jgi:SAM-dependent methyltransferase
MSVDPTAATGFAAGADAYARGRPSYPASAIDFISAELGFRPGRRVLDLGAGTGIMTALLVRTGADVVAVEPVPEMRDKLVGSLPGVEVLDGTAEALPLADAAVDAAVVAQSFHWFDASAALRELARVLRPGGGLALVWNSRDARQPWVARINEIIGWNRGAIPTYDAGDERWVDIVAASGEFTELRLREFAYDHIVDEATLLDRVTSVSYVAAMPEAERARLLDQVRALVDGFPPTFALPYRTYVYSCFRNSS